MNAEKPTQEELADLFEQSDRAAPHEIAGPYEQQCIDAIIREIRKINSAAATRVRRDIANQGNRGMLSLKAACAGIPCFPVVIDLRKKNYPSVVDSVVRPSKAKLCKLYRDAARDVANQWANPALFIRTSDFGNVVLHTNLDVLWSQTSARVLVPYPYGDSVAYLVVDRRCTYCEYLVHHSRWWA